MLEVRLGALGGGAGVAAIGLSGAGLENVTEQNQLFLGGKRIHDRAGAVGEQRHVGLIDVFPAGDRRAVEHDAVGQHVLVHCSDGLGSVLPFPAGIGEPEIDVFHVVVLNHLEDFFNVVRHR